MSAHRHTSHEHEHDFEVEPGLPEPLPADERMLWRGGPDRRGRARTVFHLRALATYFAALVAWRATTLVHDGAGVVEAAAGIATAIGLAALALGLVALLAWLSAKTTVYTVTDRRIVMRVGIVLSVTFNLPYRQIEAADLKLTRDGRGDIALTLAPSTRIAYLHLWPHARPWRVARPQPALRAIADAEAVAWQISGAWKAMRADAPPLPVRAVARPARRRSAAAALAANERLDAVEAA